jgi:hypothetical protein
MKRNQKITRVKLKINQEDALSLIAVVTSEADYKLSLAINKKFRITLRSISPLKISGDTGIEMSFSRYSDADPSKEVAHTLVSNRSGKNFLLKKLKNVDFIFQVHDSENKSDIKRIATGLREIESVTAVFSIELNSLNEKNLLYLTQ